MTSKPQNEAGLISLEGIRQNNLKNISLKLPVGKFIVVSGVSGSGKSSFAVETLCAEGQRRYIETFSPYARQFMERIGKPDVEKVRNIPPAVSIYQGNPVRTSRSTVATMSEVADFIKALFARGSTVVCSSCSREVGMEHPGDVIASVKNDLQGKSILVTFPVKPARGFNPGEVARFLKNQGFSRLVHDGEVIQITPAVISKKTGEVEIVMDRVRVEKKNAGRIAESITGAMRFGQGKVSILPLEEKAGKISTGGRLRFSSDLHCPYCDIRYPDPDPNFFSYNSPLGACPECRGFGSIIRIDRGKVIPDARKSLKEGAVRPWRSGYSAECYNDLRRFCRREEIPLDVPYERLGEDMKKVIWEGKGSWHGIKGYFKYIESKSYKMHFRVLLSRYRSYLRCPDCGGGRFRSEVLVYHVGGRNIADVYRMSVKTALKFGLGLRGTLEKDPASLMVVDEMTKRLDYMQRVGLGYLTLDRESRTLSGGEVGRLRLASALGANLTNTLYVLDEPTVGLHPRDIDNLLEVLKDLKGRGNTIVVVEHDLRVLREADTIIDLGPGPGEEGGSILFYGSPRLPAPQKESVTLKYLTGEARIETTASRRERDRKNSLRISGACLRNLDGIDVDIPLNMFVCVTGVSGSGKSTLIHDVVGASMKNFLEGKDFHPAGCSRIEGWVHFDEVVMIDQTPVATTPRANPATYTGLIKLIRNLMASAPLARERGYGPSIFSFNSGQGRCSRCGGTGHEKIEMQFLSDLYIKCQQCDGRRFKKEVLDVKFDGKTIDDFLSMTVDGIYDFLRGRFPGKVKTVEALRKVGLGYLAVGQPFTTLSGGEIQRLKIAGVLIGKRTKGRRLILMDEPTTGLHAADIRNFLERVWELVEGGDSVVVIEHNMDVVKCCDWVIDLGPEGGRGGGRVVAAGTPEEIARDANSRTAPYLREALAGEGFNERLKPPLPYVEQTVGRAGMSSVAREHPDNGSLKPPRPGNSIQIVGARHNNLQGVNVEIPLEKITLITGVSGSGKSSLAFDVLFAEGQRRYLDSVSPYVRQYLKQVPHPDVDYISMLPPTVAIEQRSSRGGIRSTVGTLTEIQPFLRLMFARAGARHCPDCKVRVNPRSIESIVEEIFMERDDSMIEILAPVVRGRKGKHVNALKGIKRKGFKKARVDGKVVSLGKIPELERYREHFIEAVAGEIIPGKTGRSEIDGLVRRAVDFGRGVFIASKVESSPCTRRADRRRGSRREKHEKIFSTLDRCPSCGRGFDELDPRNFSFNSFLGACPVCRGLGRAGVAQEEDFYDAAGIVPGDVCPACNGKRLKDEFLHVFIAGWNIGDLSSLSIDRAFGVMKSMKLGKREGRIVAPVIGEVISRLSFLRKAGVGYLALERSADTLSAGESQRVKLAASLGSELRGVCYILDEPTIGLHPADNRMIREVFKELRDKQNSIVVVEHDEETIRSADYCIELGPGGGKQGGRVVAAGSPEEIALEVGCPTGQVLSNPPVHPMRGRYRPPGERVLRISGAAANNLKEIDVEIPLGRFVCITGVSGSGKSSLLENVILEGFSRFAKRDRGTPADYDRIDGFEFVKNVKYVDQTPIGKTPRSTVSTYVGFMTEIRKLFALMPEARMRGYSASCFSFNVSGGRCEECKGRGLKKAQMTFLPLVRVVCEKCGGKRYNEEILKIKYRQRSISDVLSMTVSEAKDMFSFHRRIVSALNILDETGLGYILLGQSSPTLSGGEAQRIKLAAEMSGSTSVKDVVYLLEEPTTGLHTLDVKKILNTFHRLVDEGATVVVIEHNIDVIAEADWIVDLGPGGGDGGGEIVGMGQVPALVEKPGRSLTARFLKQCLAM